MHFILTILLLFSGQMLAGNSPIILTDSTDTYTPLRGAEYFVETETRHDIRTILENYQQLNWQTIATDALSLGIKPGRTWLHFKLRNETQDSLRFLELAYPALDFVSVYLVSQGKVISEWQTGDRTPFSTRPIEDRNFLFPLSIPSFTDYEVYIAAETEGILLIPAKIYRPTSFVGQKNGESYFFGIYYGIMLAMIGYNLFLYISLRDPTYTYYILYLSSFALMQASLNGFAFQYLAPNNPEIANRLTAFSMNATAFFVIRFSMVFLGTKTTYPRMHRLLNAVFVLSSFGLIVSIFGSYSRSIVLGNSVGLITSLALLSAGSLAALGGPRSARIYLLSFFAFLIGVILLALRDRGFLPVNSLTSYGSQIGSALEAILLSLALADRISTERKEKYLLIANQYRESLKKQHSYSQLAKILYPHQLESIKADLPLEETMPVGNGEAVVICFDIQQSSLIDKENQYDFLQRVLKGSYEIMMENYSVSEASARAYLINQLGDGFLCSVGFPFKVHQEKADAALRLAIDFVAHFERAVDDFFPDRSLYCSIGMATGDISGAFPQVGLIQYDVHGPTLVKATRYESMRRYLFSKGGIPRANILIVQDKLYQQLSPEWQKTLQRFDLLEKKVRNDEDADVLYFRLFEHGFFRTNVEFAS